jgi:uncharacterized protein
MDDIWQAAKDGDLAEVQRLVGQDPSLLEGRPLDYGPTPLMCATDYYHVEVARWLLDQGAAVDARNNNGETALLWASLDGHPPVVRLLVERGADPSIHRTRGGNALTLAIMKGHEEVMRCLLSAPSLAATINCRDRWGQTALWLACYWGRGEVTRLLLEMGADPTIPDKYGVSPLAIAQEEHIDEPRVKGRRECVAALQVRVPIHTMDRLHSD